MLGTVGIAMRAKRFKPHHEKENEQ
jgi:hypothetical protein